MKPNHRCTLAYALITFLVLGLGFGIVYAALARSFTQATLDKREWFNMLAANRLYTPKPRPGAALTAS